MTRFGVLRMEAYRNKIDSETMKELPSFSFDGEVAIIETPEDVDAVVKILEKSPVLGFDTETRPAFKKGISYSVSLLQLATEERVYLFRILKSGFPPALRDLLANPSVVKVGVGIRDDIRMLRRQGDFDPMSFVDLQEYAVRFGIEEKSFAKLMAIIFNVRISKRQRTSNWEAGVLSESQIRYAATDAWGALKMYLELDRRRE